MSIALLTLRTGSTRCRVAMAAQAGIFVLIGRRPHFRVVSKAEFESVGNEGRLRCDPSTGYELGKLFWTTIVHARAWAQLRYPTEPWFIVVAGARDALFPESEQTREVCDGIGVPWFLPRENLGAVILGRVVEASNP